ncbi:MAG: hypothetical protein GWP10_07375 [Nitrospiraceae bacterium]|nr:hypothetical protein [Nitrospiraceae bacterium]
MRNIVAGLLGSLINILGIVAHSKRRIKNGCVIPLYFHNPQKNLFKRSIKWLSNNHFVFISTAQLVDILKGSEQLKEKAVWISFDDGWKQNIENVVPTILEYKMVLRHFVWISVTLHASGRVCH